MKKLYIDIAPTMESVSVEEVTDFVRFVYTKEYEEWYKNIIRLSTLTQGRDTTEEVNRALANTYAFKAYVAETEEPPSKEEISQVIGETLEVMNDIEMAMVARAVDIEVDAINIASEKIYAMYAEGIDTTYVFDLYTGDNHYDVTVLRENGDGNLEWYDTLYFEYLPTDADLTNLLDLHVDGDIHIISNSYADNFNHDYKVVKTETVLRVI